MMNNFFLGSHWGPQVIRAFRLWGLAKYYFSLSQRQNAIFNNLRCHFYDEFWRNAAKAVGASIEDTGYNYLKIIKNGRWTLVKNSNVMLDDHLTCQVTGNKPLIHHLLNEGGYPVPRFFEFDLTTIDKAYDFLCGLAGNVVVKPAYGGWAGKGVTTKISSVTQLKKAAYRATSYCKKLLVEEEIRGHSYRLLFLDGEFLDAVRRDPPTVVGDGKTNIKELIKNENTNRVTHVSITSLWPLSIDLECKRTLQEQGLSLQDVPSKGQSIIVKYAINQNNASENHTVRDSVHKSYIDIGKKIMLLLDLKFGGIDIIAENLSLPLDKVGWVINEINANPGLHHHVLVSETSKRAPVGELLLKYFFTKKYLSEYYEPKE